MGTKGKQEIGREKKTTLLTQRSKDRGRQKKTRLSKDLRIYLLSCSQVGVWGKEEQGGGGMEG